MDLLCVRLDGWLHLLLQQSLLFDCMFCTPWLLRTSQFWLCSIALTLIITILKCSTERAMMFLSHITPVTSKPKTFQMKKEEEKKQTAVSAGFKRQYSLFLISESRQIFKGRGNSIKNSNIYWAPPAHHPGDSMRHNVETKSIKLKYRCTNGNTFDDIIADVKQCHAIAHVRAMCQVMPRCGVKTCATQKQISRAISENQIFCVERITLSERSNIFELK